MYIDPRDPNRTIMEQEVNEATAQLKGLLGIGGGGEKQPPPSSTTTNKQQQENPAASEPGAGGGGNKPNNQKNKRNRKNKKDNKQQQQKDNKEKDEGNHQQQQQNRVHSKSPSASARPPKDGNKKVGGKSGKKNANKKNSKDNKDNKGNNPAGGGNASVNIPAAVKKPGPNFAWSAFQSSPDASKLPIPAFSPANTDKKVVEVSDAAAENQALSSLLPAAPGTSTTVPPRSNDDIDLSNAPRAEDLEDQQIAESKKKITSGQEEPAEGEKDEAPSTSKTGINLAALASPKTEATAPKNTPPPMPSTQHPTQQPPSFPSQGPQPQQQPPPFPQYQHPGNPYGHPMQQMQQHQAYHAPPGYMTIQVQVPPALMPGRQMVVSSPAGYPVRVVVPEGIPPGMVIPVHVPAGPPMHMMTPQQQQQQQQQAYQQQQQQQQQRYYHQSGR